MRCSASATTGCTAETENEDEKIAAVDGIGQSHRFVRDDLARQVDVAAAAEAVHGLLAEQMPVRHDRRLDDLLIGIEDPDVLSGPAVEHELIAHGRAGLAEPDDAHAVGKKRIGLFREGSVGREFDHGFSPVGLDDSHARQRAFERLADAGDAAAGRALPVPPAARSAAGRAACSGRDGARNSGRRRRATGAPVRPGTGKICEASSTSPFTCDAPPVM